MQKLFGLETNLKNFKDHRFIGMYEDIIEHVDTGKVERRKGFNDVTTLLSKGLQIHMMQTMMSENVQSEFGFSGTPTLYTQENKDQLKQLTGIVSWEVGSGLDSSVVSDVNNISDENIRKTTISKLMFVPENDALTSWTHITDNYTNGWDTGSLWSESGSFVENLEFIDLLYNNYTQEYHNSLFIRKQEKVIPGTSYSSKYYRKDVSIVFVEPKYYTDPDDINSTDNTSLIIQNLINGTFSISNVTDWEVVDKITPFIMVQQVFNQDEQNFTWREFSLVQGNPYTTSQGVDVLEQINTTDIDFDPELGLTEVLDRRSQILDGIFTGKHPEQSDQRYLVDYKIHKQITKTSNMKITRRIVFGFIPFSTNL